jgi:chromosome segregation ATPase
MNRLALLIPITLLLGALAGCSVFGIATRSDLEEAIRQEDADQRELAGRITDVNEQVEAARRELAAVDARLRPRLASLDSAVAANDERVAAATRQWTAMQAAMVTHLDSLQTEVILVSRDMDLVRQGMDLAAAQAAVAHRNSRQAMQVHYEVLNAERLRLQERLLELDQRLGEWPADQDSLVSGAVPAAAADEPAGRIDIRVIEPEQAAGATSTASAGGS